MAVAKRDRLVRGAEKLDNARDALARSLERNDTIRCGGANSLRSLQIVAVSVAGS